MPHRRRPSVFVAAALLLAAASTAAPSAVAKAPTEQSDTSFWQFRVQGLFALGPLQGAVVPGITYKREIRSPQAAFDRTYAAVNFDVPMSPSTIMLVPSVDVLPLALFHIRLAYMGVMWTGVDLGRGYSLTFNNSNPAGYESEVLNGRKGEGEFRFSHRVQFKGTFRYKAGFVAILSETEFTGWFNGGGGGNFLYDAFYDSLVRIGEFDATIMNRSILLFEVWKSDEGGSLMIGINNQYVKSIGTGKERDRLGLVVSITPAEKFGGMTRPQLVLGGGVALIDPNREFNPYMELALRLYWDFKDEPKAKPKPTAK